MNSIRQYKTFVDGLVRLTKSIQARRFLDGVWHPEPPPDQVKFAQLLTELTVEQRRAIAELFTEERLDTIHDVLVYLTEKGYRVSKDEEGLPVEPYGTTLYWDFVCRVHNDPWPDEQ